MDKFESELFGWNSNTGLKPTVETALHTLKYISKGLLVCFTQICQTTIHYFYSYSFLKVTMLNKENCPVNEKNFFVIYENKYQHQSITKW